MWKYAEGYPHKRYYGGCENVDESKIWRYKLACKVFNCNLLFQHIVVHKHNAEAVRAILPEGGKILSVVLTGWWASSLTVLQCHFLLTLIDFCFFV